MKNKIYTLLSIFVITTQLIICSQEDIYWIPYSKAEINKYLVKQAQDRIYTIMYQGHNGIDNYNKNIQYAAIKNITQDLVLPQTALYFQPYTDIGTTFLFDSLSKPISPQDTSKTLHHRQIALKKMFENYKIYQEIAILLEQAKIHEKTIIELMINRDKSLEFTKFPNLSSFGLLEPVVKPWYILEHYKKTNPLYNSSIQAFNAFTTLLATSFVIPAAMNTYAIATDPHFTLIDREQIYKKSNLFFNIFQTRDISLQGAQELYSDIQDFSYTPTSSQDSRKLGQSMQLAWLPLYYAYATSNNIYQDYLHGLKNRNLLYALNQIITIAEKIELICKNHQIPLQFTTHHTIPSQGKSMIEGLKHPRYQETDSSIVATPWVNTFINEVYAQDMYLAPYLAIIAEVDAYAAIANKMYIRKDLSNEFCITHFLHQDRPEINGKNIWNVIVKEPVTNNFSEKRNVILTGPNAGGKSTIMRSILQNMVLSQTFGFATGSSFSYTPFDIFDSYLTIKDDITKGLSRFKSEIVTAVTIVEQAKTLQPHQKYFFIIDELFTGTGGRDGENSAYEFITQDLAPHLNHTFFIFATHFDKLKEVESNFPNLFANYKIDAPVISADGSINYPFTLSKGANNTNIALLLKHNSGLLGNTALAA